MCNHTGQADEGEAQQREACKSSEGERETDMLLLVVCVLSVYTGETSLPPPHTHTAGLCLCSLISHLLVGLFLDSEFTAITPEGVLECPEDTATPKPF